MFLKNYLKSRRSYISANSQAVSLPEILLQEIQNLIRKHLQSYLDSSLKWKQLDKWNVDLSIICHLYSFTDSLYSH